MSIIYYRHRKTQQTYALYSVEQVKHTYDTGFKVMNRLLPAFNFHATDPIQAGSFVCFYASMQLDKEAESEPGYWARPADIFFDGRFERVFAHG